jgi:hypothetical protein
MIEVTPTAGRGSEPLQVNVIKVEAPKAFGEMVVLEPPSMALNSHDTPVVFEMLHNFVIAPTMPAQQIVDTARSKGKLRHLAISCHSYVDKATGATRLDIGRGFDASNTGLFTQLGETIGGGVLWFAGCAACGSEHGKNDVKARATNARCYAVGPVMFMTQKERGEGFIWQSPWWTCALDSCPLFSRLLAQRSRGMSFSEWAPGWGLAQRHKLRWCGGRLQSCEGVIGSVIGLSEIEKCGRLDRSWRRCKHASNLRKRMKRI